MLTWWLPGCILCPFLCTLGEYTSRKDRFFFDQKTIQYDYSQNDSVSKQFLDFN